MKVKRRSLPLAVLIRNPQSIAWRGRRAFLLRLTELHNPDAGVDIIEKDVIAELSSAPGERKVRTEPLRVAGPQTRDLSALPVEVAAQFARNVEDTAATTVITHHQNVIFHAHIMRAAFRYGVFGDLTRVGDVRNVNHVEHATRGNTPFVVNVELFREDFVADKYIVLVTIDFVRSRYPSIAVQLAVIETQLADEPRVFRAAAFDAVADIEDHQAVTPVREISQSVFNLNVVQITSFLELSTCDTAGDFRPTSFGLPSRNLFRILHVLEIDHAH